ncbi:MAG: phage N-6-adenine-methyltransferase [Actinomycetota bacterium]|nr:phage N-6-adenine-methyltransferase [Actinomycetota bacterium]
MSTRHQVLTGNVEWYTPRPYLDAAVAVMGAIDLDPASCDLAQRNVRAVRYFTTEDDGLRQDWWGRVWLNPP